MLHDLDEWVNGQMRRNCIVTAVFIMAAQFTYAASADAQSSSREIFVPIDFSSLTGDLAVEVDGIDMTGFAELADGGILVVPAIPLDPGTYQIVVYLWTGDNYEVLAVQEISIEGSANNGVQASVSAVNEGGTQYYNGDDTDEFARSNGQIEVTAVGGKLKAGAAWVATTEPEEEIAGRPVDLGEYYLEYSQTGANLDMTARLGHQTLSFERSLVADLTRRGASAYFTTPDQRLEFGFFAVQTADAIGVDNVFGLADDQDAMFGATVAIVPSASQDFRFGVSGYSGRGVPYDDILVGEGSGASVFANGSFGDQRFRYQFDLGYTEFDEDADLAAFSPETGTALLASLEYDTWQNEAGGDLTLGLAYERVEADYFSLANQNISPGREDIRLTFDYFGESTSLTGMLEHKITNIAGPPDVETDRIVTAQIDGTHVPYFNGQTPDWMGDPLLEFGALVTIQDRIETPLLAQPQLDFVDIQAYAGLAVQHENWGWSTTYTFGKYDDESAANADETSNELYGTLDWSDNDRWVFSSNASLLWIEDFSGNYLDSELGFTVSYDIVPGEWDASASLSYFDYGAPGFDDGASLGADLTWSFAPATELVFSGGIAKGGLATESPEDPEWFVGLMLRHNTEYFSGGF